MPPDILFAVVEVGGVLATVGLAILLFARPWPVSRWLRGLFSVAVAWISSVVYTIYVLNPAGTAAARSAGMDFPENHFDNNTIASALLGGWLYPAIGVGIFAAVRAVRERAMHRRDGRAPNNASERTRGL